MVTLLDIFLDMRQYHETHVTDNEGKVEISVKTVFWYERSNLFWLSTLLVARNGAHFIRSR